ncbi:MAG: M18 family aminopeptidase, partial [Clostridiales bacterium]|nr:M18 family aminopeptidase [Clostridiales bacterium]
TEKYGGMLCSSWMDRPLSVAGRITVDTGNGIEVKNVSLGEPSVIIPNVAIHMNRNANDGASFNAAVDMLPLYSTDIDGATLMERVSAAAGVEEEKIITTDLFVFNPQPGVEWHEMISAPRLDDLQCAYASLTAFIDSGKSGESGGSVPVFCLFDNEEVGSQTKQGAASTFLCDVLERISSAAGLDMGEHRRRIANSFLVSCDNAHAVHPNHSELADRNHSVYMNQGIVIKYNANQRYTSDAVSAALFRLICEEADVPFQYYANRADMPGGSTLGNIANTQVSLNTVDIGLAQLAMHSAFETAGAKDTDFLCRALTVFFGKSIVADGDGRYIFK